MSEQKGYQLTHLQQLEAESIFIMREVAAQFGKPALLFSGGKDSIVMVRLAQKAFWPAKLPFPLVHVDTGHNFDETIQFRDDLANDVGGDLVVASVQEEIDAGRAKEETGPNPSRNRLQIPALLNAIEKNQYDACLGGARREDPHPKRGNGRQRLRGAQRLKQIPIRKKATQKLRRLFCIRLAKRGLNPRSCRQPRCCWTAHQPTQSCQLRGFADSDRNELAHWSAARHGRCRLTSPHDHPRSCEAC